MSVSAYFDRRAVFMVARSHIPAFSGVHVVLRHGINVKSKRSATVACKAAGHVTGCEVDLHALGDAIATRVGGADLQVSRGHICGDRMNRYDERSGFGVSKKRSHGAVYEDARCVQGCGVDLNALAGAKNTAVSGRADLEVSGSPISTLHRVFRDDSFIISVTSKRSPGAARKVARCLTARKVDLHVPGGPGASHVGRRADLQASRSPFCSLHRVLSDERPDITATRKRSTTAACKVARCLTGCEADLHVPGGPGAAHVGGRADLQASGSPISSLHRVLSDERPDITVTSKCSPGAACKVARCLTGCAADLHVPGGPRVSHVGRRADLQLVASLICSLHTVFRDDSFIISVTSKRSPGAACKVARCLTGCAADLHVPGGPRGAHVGGRADVGVAGSRIADIQIDWQVTGLGRTSERIASGTRKVNECRPTHGVPDGVDDDDAVGDWCKVAVIAAEHAKQNMPAPQNEIGIRAHGCLSTAVHKANV